MSYPSNRSPRDREHRYFEDDPEQDQRGVEGRGRSQTSERDYRSRTQRFGEDERPGGRDRFGERSYMDPYSGRPFGQDEDERSFGSRQRGYAPYPYGSEDYRRNLEDWQQPYQMENERGGSYGRYYTGESSQRPAYRSRELDTYGREASRSGSFRGKGPKGYQRSDERLREDICERLTDDIHIDASDITLEVSDGEVTMSGTVPDRRTKRAAEDLVEEISGVKQVHNALRVEWQRGADSEPDDSYGSRSTRLPIRH
jgi:hypothetical protein